LQSKDCICKQGLICKEQESHCTAIQGVENSEKDKQHFATQSKALHRFARLSAAHLLVWIEEGKRPRFVLHHDKASDLLSISQGFHICHRPCRIKKRPAPDMLLARIFPRSAGCVHDCLHLF